MPSAHFHRCNWPWQGFGARERCTQAAHHSRVSGWAKKRKRERSRENNTNRFWFACCCLCTCLCLCLCHGLWFFKCIFLEILPNFMEWESCALDFPDSALFDGWMEYKSEIWYACAVGLQETLKLNIRNLGKYWFVHSNFKHFYTNVRDMFNRNFDFHILWRIVLWMYLSELPIFSPWYTPGDQIKWWQQRPCLQRGTK